MNGSPNLAVKRAMTLKVYIDNNVWDFLFEREIDLSEALPSNEFLLFITREAEFEIPPMPTDKREYVESMMIKASVTTDSYFGFYDERYSANEQRSGGFGDKFDTTVKGGRFISRDESVAMKSEKHLLGMVNEKTLLLKNEADISLAARATHSVILTCDHKKALKRARENTGRVIDIKKWDSKISLSEFIKSELIC